MGFGSSPSAQIINIVAQPFYSMWETRNPVEFGSPLLTKKHSGKGSANREVKGGLYNHRTVVGLDVVTSCMRQ